MTTRTHIAWPVLVLVAVGCSHSAPEANSRPPLPNIKLMEEQTFSGHDRIVASGVDDYIATFLDAGWLRALSDARVLSRSNTAADPSTKLVGNGQSVFRHPLRVKDVFCYYYLRRQGEQLASQWKSD